MSFTLSSGNWAPNTDVNDILVELSSGGSPTGWRYFVAADNSVEEYDAAGLLLQITERNGLVQKFSFSNGSGGIQYGSTPSTNGYLAPACSRPSGFSLPFNGVFLLCVTDDQGRQINLTYGGNGRINKFADPLGQIYQYAYDTSSNLQTVTYPDSTVLTYIYNESALNGGVSQPNILTGITDENGNRYATYNYDGTGRAVGETLAGGADAISLSFGTGSTTVTDALTTARTYTFSTLLNVQKSTGSSQPAGSGCAASSSVLGYDANGNVASRIDFNGNQVCYAYDTTRNLETKRVEGLTSSVACSTALTTPPSPTTANPVRTISTQWHTFWRLPVRVAEPLKFTTYVYNGDTYNGSVVTCAPSGATVPSPTGTQPIVVLCQKIVQATTDATGSQGFSAIASGTPRVWSYAYNSHSQVLTADGPRTEVSDVTTYTYYTDTDPSIGNRGNLATVTNALGHVTSITSYDANGRPLTIVDPNSLTTTLTYDARGRLTSKAVGGESTTYTYDNAGQLTLVTLPDGSFLNYSYDAAHRLTQISDALANKIIYTLDAMGNRTREDVKDPGNVLAQTRNRVFDALNRLYQDIGATNPSTQITTYAYDANGNLTSVTDPLTHVTSNSYDALNRLIRVTNPNSGQVNYAYSGLDQLTSVTDPRMLATSYAYDGLNNLNQLISPDTGTTVNTYDAAGNLLTQTDAKGQVTTYAYDALNRVTSSTFNDGSKFTYTYDQGTNGNGRLTRIAEFNPQNQLNSQIDYAYDQKGRVISVTSAFDSWDTSHTTAYRYDSSGRLAGITYPHSTVETGTYGFDSTGRINQITANYYDGFANPPGMVTQVVVQSVQYQPFGGVKSFTLGNGQVVTRGFDQDGRVASYSLGAQSFAVGYDTASRVSSITDAANSSNTNTYSYDALDRLTNAVTPATPYAYSYDATGNRITKTVGTGTDTYAYGSTSNRLASITPATGPLRTYTHDANGSVVNDGNLQYVYDLRGRLYQITNTAACLVSKFRVNALGQRVRKTVTRCDTGALVTDSIYVYDLAGHLIVEMLPQGQYKRAYGYLYDLPVVMHSTLAD